VTQLQWRCTLAPSPSDGEGGTGGEGGACAFPLPLPPLHWMERGQGGQVSQLLHLSTAPRTRYQNWFLLCWAQGGKAYRGHQVSGLRGCVPSQPLRDGETW